MDFYSESEINVPYQGKTVGFVLLHDIVVDREKLLTNAGMFVYMNTCCEFSMQFKDASFISRVFFLTHFLCQAICTQ